jgi:hypothetical protein
MLLEILALPPTVWLSLMAKVCSFASQIEDRLTDTVLFHEVDPWRPDTPHSVDAKDRADTILRPFKLIPSMWSVLFVSRLFVNASSCRDLEAVHHWDENGLANILNEPPDIRKIHGDEIYFVTEWLKDWKATNVKS